MKKKSIIKPVKKKRIVEEWLINTSAIVLFTGAFIWIIYNAYVSGNANQKSQDTYLTSLPPPEDTIPHSKVCMIEDVYQGDYKTLSVSLNNKTYYGCDMKATHKLIADCTSRLALDPISKRMVDKASATISVHPEKNGKVLYFESKATHNEYLNVLKEKKVSGEAFK